MHWILPWSSPLAFSCFLCVWIHFRPPRHCLMPFLERQVFTQPTVWSFLILFKCKLKNRTCRNVFIVFIKTLHLLVLYIIILVIYILLDNYVFITIFLVANCRHVITIPQASNERSMLLATMVTPLKEHLQTVNRVRVLWRPHPISKYLKDPVNSCPPMRGLWELFLFWCVFRASILSLQLFSIW